MEEALFGDSLAALSAWALASAASGQDVHGQEGHDDDRRRDSNDGDGGGGYNHTAILPSSCRVERARLGARIDHLSFLATIWTPRSRGDTFPIRLSLA
jgi:hypothetical protein